jgi:hypothetical protein
VTNQKSNAPAKNIAPFAKVKWECACAWTGSITARIAGKHATCPSPIPVPAEMQKIAMQFDPDIRLAAAAGGVARYLGDAAGLAANVVAGWQSAIITVCNLHLSQLRESGQRLEVIVTRSPDRIEVAVTRDAVAHSGTGAELQQSLEGVDQVQHENKSDKAVTRLTKFVSESASAN